MTETAPNHSKKSINIVWFIIAAFALIQIGIIFLAANGSFPAGWGMASAICALAGSAW